MDTTNQTPSNPGSSGSLVGSIIVVIILIIGAIYLFRSKPTVAPTESTPPAPTAAEAQSLEIDASAAATETNNLNQDISNIPLPQ